MVVSASGRPRWAGGSPALRRLLYEMLAGAVVQIETMPFEGLTPDDLKYLRSERDWFRVQEGRTLALRVGPSHIDKAVAGFVAARLNSAIDSAIDSARRTGAGS